jgi:O-antigen ligase
MQPVVPSVVDPYPLRRPLERARAVGGKERYVLGLLLLATYYYTIPVLKTPLGYSTYPTLDDFATVLFVLASLSALSSRIRSVESRIFPLLWVAALLSLPSALISYLGNPEGRALRYGILLSAHYMKMFLVFASVAVLVMDETRFRRLLKVVWLGSVFVGVYALLQYVGILSFRSWAVEFAESGPWSFGLENEATQALGPLSVNHAVIGNYMVVAVMISFAIVRTAKPMMKLLAQLSIPFFVVISVLSRSRAGLMGVLVGLVVYLILSKVRPAAIVALVCGCAAAYVIIQASPELHERFILAEPGKTIGEYSSGRLEGWAQILTYVVKRPYILASGIGLGNMTFLYQRGELNLVAGHNNYLHWLVECGVIGLALPLLVLGRLLRIFHSLLQGDRFHREIGIAFCSLVVALLWVAVTQENLTPSPGMGRLGAYFAFLFGAAVALYRSSLLRSRAARPRATSAVRAGE